MAAFTPDLDDGELWLPAVIIPDIADHHLHYMSGSSPDLALLEDLAQQLAAFGFFDRTRPLPPPKQTTPHLLLPPPPPALYDVYGQRTRAGTGAYLPKPRRGLQFSTGKPLPVQPQPQQQVRARPPPLQANRYVPPVRPVGPAGGTGVFLPRLAVDGKKKSNKNNEGMKGGEWKKQQKDAAAAEKTQEMALPLSPASEMGLPKEWTY